MASKPPVPSVKRALDKSKLEQSKSNPFTYVNRSTGRSVNVDGSYGQEDGGGWKNWSNKKRI